MKYDLKKNLVGKYVLKFACPNCSAGLSAPLDQAGSQDHCPDCQTTFVVPAKDKLEQWQKQKDEQARKAKESADAADAQRLAAQAEQDRITVEKQRLADQEKSQKLEQQRLQEKAQQQQALNTQQSALLLPANIRYSRLFRYLSALRFFGILNEVVGILFLCLSVLNFLNNDIDTGASFMTAGIGIMTGGAIMLIANEVIKVVIDIEANSRQAR